MTITGTVKRYATLRSGPHVATVTRCAPDSGPVAYLVEHSGPHGPVFVPCMDWRKALEVAAAAVTNAATRHAATWN